MDQEGHTDWVGRNFAFGAKYHSVPGQPQKEISPILIEGTVVSVITDKKSGTRYVGINVPAVCLHNRIFDIIDRMMIIEIARPAHLYFDGKRIGGNECLIGDFVLK